MAMGDQEILDGFEAMLDLEDPAELGDAERTAQMVTIGKAYAEAKARLDAAKRETDKLEEVVKTLESSLVVQLQNAGMRKFTVDGIGTFTHSTRLYPSVKDDEAAMAWLVAHGHEELVRLKVDMSGLAAVIKEQQESGGELPIGVEFWEKQSCTLRRTK